MKYGLNDNTVKRIAALAHHSDGGMMDNVHNIYNKLTHHETINSIANAHNTDAMQHRFKNKDDENKFKKHLVIAASINRGSIETMPQRDAISESEQT